MWEVVGTEECPERIREAEKENNNKEKVWATFETQKEAAQWLRIWILKLNYI